jgi:hypothetical protein
MTAPGAGPGRGSTGAGSTGAGSGQVRVIEKFDDERGHPSRVVKEAPRNHRRRTSSRAASALAMTTEPALRGGRSCGRYSRWRPPLTGYAREQSSERPSLVWLDQVTADVVPPAASRRCKDGHTRDLDLPVVEESALGSPRVGDACQAAVRKGEQTKGSRRLDIPRFQGRAGVAGGDGVRRSCSGRWWCQVKDGHRTPAGHAGLPKPSAAPL